MPAIASAVGTPFYCYSTATLERHYRVFAGAFADVPALVCYAMKANSSLAVVRLFSELGAGADIVSVGDIVKVWVHEIDKTRRRVSLTMIAPGTERAQPQRHARLLDIEQPCVLRPGIAQRLRGAVRHSDIVARLSGDEFAVVMPGVATQSDVGRIARVLLDSCRAPLVIDGHDIVVSCSIGAAVYPYHGQTQEALLRAADAAQYRAKEARNSWHYFSPDMHDRMTPTPGVAALRRAIEAELLEVHYQPIVDLGSGRISAVEALVRWTHLGVAVPAGAVVLLAEESGLIVALTEFVLRTGLRQMRRWDATTGRTDLRLAVNLSALQVHEGLIESVDAIAGDAGFDLRRLDFELTERAAMRASAQALAVLHGLRARGITLTIDDFGTGYSALSRLERLPIDAMKIDKAFLEQVANHRNGVIARAIIAMGHALGLAVVAEGVETAEQLDFLRRQGCDHAQGFLLSAPAHGEHLHGMLVSGVVVPPASAAV